MAVHNDLGKKGEAIAASFLQRKGYEIIDENWCYGKAEVDLIALYDDTIIFIEVKTRSGNYFAEPEDFVDAKKQKLFAEAAEEYVFLVDHKGEIRFDIIAILIKNDQSFDIKHIEDAWWNYE